MASQLCWRLDPKFTCDLRPEIKVLFSVSFLSPIVRTYVLNVFCLHGVCNATFMTGDEHTAFLEESKRKDKHGAPNAETNDSTPSTKKLYGRQRKTENKVAHVCTFVHITANAAVDALLSFLSLILHARRRQQDVEEYDEEVPQYCQSWCKLSI